MKVKFLTGILIFSFLAPALASAQQSQIEIVFDASRSMNDPMGGGTKLDEAKKALTTLAGQISPDSLVGLRIFGKNPVINNVRESCLDSRLVIPIQPFNKQAMLNEVAGLTSYGQTALGYSLQLAGQDFSPDPAVKKTIILISDGEESCGMDPINVVGSFKARGINFVVHAIGFDADAKGKAQMQQLSNMTGGSYQDAKNSVELKESLETVAQQENLISAAAPKKEEAAEPPAPEEKLLRAGRENAGENILAATAGAKIVTATNEDMAELIDGADDHSTVFSEGDTAVFSFKDGQAALLQSFAVPIAEENSQNPGMIELSGSLDGPETGFFPVLQAHPKNKVDFKNINQEFKIDPPAAVRFLKVRLGPGVSGGGAIIAELKVFGKYLSEAELKDVLSKRKPVERNLLAKDAGGRIIASSDPSFAGLIDGETNDTVSIDADQEAVFGFSQDKSAVISSISVPIFETSDHNCKTFEFSVSQDSPSDHFTPAGTFKTQNIAMAGDPYQVFKFPQPVKAKYLKMKLIDGHTGSSCELAELRANGLLESESAAPAAVPAPAPAAPASAASKSEDDFYKDFKPAS